MILQFPPGRSWQHYWTKLLNCPLQLYNKLPVAMETKWQPAAPGTGNKFQICLLSIIFNIIIRLIGF